MLTTIKAEPKPYIYVHECTDVFYTMLSHTSRALLNAKRFLLTYDDPKDQIKIGLNLAEFLTDLMAERMEFIVVGKEAAPTTGLIHYHALVIFKTNFYKRDIHYFDFNNIHPNIEPVKGSAEKAYEYVIKNGDFWQSSLNYFTQKESQAIQERIKKNKLLLTGDILKEFEDGKISSVDLIRASKIRTIFTRMEKPSAYKKKLILWFKGPTGEGKTRMAVSIAEQYYECNYWLSNDSLKWFDGYNNQRVAIVDDFRKGMLTDWNFLLRLLDGYNLIVQIKGGFVKWNPELIIITSPASPHEAFSWINKEGEEQAWDKEEQLMRRLTHKDELQVYDFPLWDTEQKRLENTIREELGMAPMEEEEWSVIEPEGFITPS